ncbi:sigma factor-like helix-turn-helix DNA-binding protein [Rhizobium ruizarguesonis]|nr:sigma factor-like helix-turn-helix DNA-binding protein [Rhizobium ruizarguesonis]
MATPIRAFLMLKVGDSWKVTVHRELEDLLGQWKERPEPSESSAVVHIGFERPQSRIFDEVINLYSDRVLLTSSAKYGLPFGFESTSSPVGTAEGMPVFLATKGWGYLLDVADLPAFDETRDRKRRTYGWVTQFLSENPGAGFDFSSAGIWDDGEYLQNEGALPHPLRKDAGIYRHSLIISDEYDPCAFAKAAPPWLMERRFDTMDVSARVGNVFIAGGIETVSDLATFSLDDLLGTQNFGRKSAKDLLFSLNAALLQGPYSRQVVGDVHGSLTASRTLIQAIIESLGKVPERAAEIVLRRMGLSRAPQTLQQVGDDFGITRERVRQIEAKTTAKLLRDEVWDDILTQKLIRLLRDRTSPLPLRGIDAADEWFAGIGENGEALRYLLELIPTAAKIVEFGGMQYLGFLTQSQWEAAVSNGRGFLDASADRKLTLEQCKSAVTAELPSNCREFTDLLWEECARNCHFVEQDGVNILLGHGRGADHFVHAVLAASDRPLHYTEIANLAAKRSGREFELRRIHNSAANVGHLFGLGTYGLECHSPLNAAELAALAEDALEIVCDGPPERQWHANELLAELIEREKADPERTTKYVLDIALKKSGVLEGFGRLVWAKASDTAVDASARIDIRQAIIAVLENAGEPLEVSEIRNRVRSMRGLDKPFQMHVVDPILRLGPSLYGLNDRDISLKREDQPPVLDSIVDWLEQIQKGVHQSELDGSPVLKALGISGLVLFGLASNDYRMRVSAGRYLYLEKWGESRRESLVKAVRGVMEMSERPLSMDDILVRVEGRLGRPCDRPAVVSCLKSIDAHWNPATAKWAVTQLAAEDEIGTFAL